MAETGIFAAHENFRRHDRLRRQQYAARIRSPRAIGQSPGNSLKAVAQVLTD